MKRYKLDLICILIIATISAFVTIRNFRAGYSLIGGDAGVVQEYPLSAFKEALYVWFDRDNTGSQFGVNPSSLFPYLSLLAFLKFFGCSAIFGQKVYFFLMFFISGISSYYLARMFIGRFSPAALAGAFFYMFNHYTMVSWSSAVSNYSFTYMLTPVFIALFIKGIETGSNRYVVLLSLTTMVGLGGNLSLTGIVLIALAIYLIFYIVTERKIYKPLYFSFKVFILTIALNLWWWMPTLFSIKGLAENVQARGNLGWLDWMNWRTSFLNLFRLDGYTGWLNSFPYGPNFINKDILLAIGYFIPILAVSSFFWFKKYKKLGYFAILVLISLFLAKGKHSPVGWVFLCLFKYVPGFSIFRSSYDKFIPLAALGYACLLSIAVYEFSSFFKKRNVWLSRGGITLVIFIIVLYPYPFWKGNLIRTKPNDGRTFFVKISDEYREAAEWLNDKENNFRIFTIPQKRGDYFEYIWGYFGPSIDRYLYNKPITDSLWPDINTVFEKTKNIVSLLRLYTIKYIFLHFDNIHYREVYRLDEGIKKSQYIQHEKDFGMLRFYSVIQKYLLSKIYADEKGIWVQGGDESLPYLANHGFLKGKPVLFFSSENKKNELSNMPMDFLRGIILCNKQNLDFPNNLPYINLLWDKRDKFNKGEFYIVRDSEYDIKVDISPNFISYYKKRDISFNEDMGEKGEFSKWSIGDKYAGMSLKRISKTLYAELYFSEDSEKDEYIQLKRQAVDIDLKKSPVLIVTYMVADPRVQTLQVVLGIDFNNDKKAEGYLRNIWAPAFLNEYIYDALQNAKNAWPNADNYRVVEIELYPHKKWKADCSKGFKGKYKFYIANIKFCNFAESKEMFEERKYAVNLDFESGEEIIKKDQEQYIELSKNIGGVNLIRYPNIMFNCIGCWDRIERIEFFLDLDLDGDNKKDIEEKALVLYPIYQNARRHEFEMDAKKNIKYKFRDKGYINLLDVKWHIYCKRPYIDKGLFLFRLNNLKAFSRKLIEPSGQEFTLPMFKLDNEKYTFKKNFLSKKDFENIQFKAGKVKLSKGWHSVSSLLTNDNNFRIDSISISDKNFTNAKKTLCQDIKYEKINPTRYKVTINPNNTFWLVFSETFNSGWKAYIYKSANDPCFGMGAPNPQSAFALWQMWKDRGNRIELKRHYKVNGYANAWRVDKVKSQNEKGKTKEIEIIIEYVPQRFFELGVLISSIGLLCSVGFLWIKRFQGK